MEYDVESRINFLERELRQATIHATKGKTPETRQSAVAYRESVMLSLQRHYKIQYKLRHDRHPRRKRRCFRVKKEDCA